MTLTSRRFTVDDTATAQEFFHSRGWTDGLPVVLPTADAVQACLEWAVLPAEHLVGVEPVRQRDITAEKIAVNAVMAGCLPMHFPVVVTAVAAILEEPFLLHGVAASTGGSAVLVVVNGPIRQELAMDATFNAVGPSDRATTCIGRAVRLVITNLLDVHSGGIDRSTFGHPGKISYCISEDEENSPWPSLAAERLGDPHVSAVTVMAAMAPRQVMNEWDDRAGTDPRHLRRRDESEHGPLLDLARQLRHRDSTPTSCAFCRRELVEGRRSSLRVREGTHSPSGVVRMRERCCCG